MRRSLFFKIFPHVHILCKLLTRNSNQGSIIDKRPKKNIYYGLRVKLTVFIALTNCFRKILWNSYVLLSFLILFVVKLLSLTDQRSNWFFYDLSVNLDNAFNCHLMSPISLNILILRKRW